MTAPPGPRVARYWAQYLASLPPGAPRPSGYLEAFHFGTIPERAHEITALVLAGIKTATGGLLWALEADDRPIPRPGDRSIVTNGGDDPACIVRTTEVRVIPYDEVGEEYALAGGEGDRTLVGWRALYWRYIEKECARLGREPHRKAPLVMERFEVAYREPLAPGA